MTFLCYLLDVQPFLQYLKCLRGQVDTTIFILRGPHCFKYMYHTFILFVENFQLMILLSICLDCKILTGIYVYLLNLIENISFLFLIQAIFLDEVSMHIVVFGP